MPGRDMPLAQLKAYAGSRGCPVDFEKFWRTAAEHAAAVELEMQLEPADLGSEEAEYFFVYLTASDGARLRAKYIRPCGTTLDALVLQFHDYPDGARGWFHLSRYNAIGFAVLAPECRGQGGRSEAGALGRGTTSYSALFTGMDDPNLRNMYLYHLYEDAMLWARAAAELAGPLASRMVYGEGQGGALAIAAAAMVPGFERCAAHYPLLCDYDRVYELDYDKGPYMGMNFYCRWFDPTGERYDSIFDRLAYFDAKNFAPLVTCPVLMSTGLQDTVSPPSAQFAVFNNLRSEKRHLVYPKHGHELNNFFENELLCFLGKQAGQ